MFICAVRLTKNATKRNFIYYIYGIAFLGAGSWSNGNYFDFIALTIAHQGINTFLVLSDGTTDDINDSAGDTKTKFSIIFTKSRAKFCLSCLNIRVFTI